MIKTLLRYSLLPAAARATPRPAVIGSDRLFIFQPDHLGDIILSEPAVRYLRSIRPQSELIAVVGPWSAEITRMAWPVDRIVEVAFPAFERGASGANPIDPYVLLKRESRRLRDIEVDDAVVLRDDAWWASWLASASTGGKVVTSSHRLTASFATHSAPSLQSPHRTATALTIIATYLAATGSDNNTNKWDMSPHLNAFTKIHRLDASQAQPRIIIHPGSGAAVKAWPISSWRAVLAQLSAAEIILTGSEREREECMEIAAGFDHVTVVAGGTTLAELAALFAGSTMALGTDNGPMHLAGAVGTPTVRIFGPSSVQRYGPWPGTPRQLAISAGWSCPRCDDLSSTRTEGCGCMAAVTPAAVIESVQKVLHHAA